MGVKRKGKHENFNKIPKFCTADTEDGSCVIYELGTKIHKLRSIEVIMKPVSKIRYNGNDAVEENPNGHGTMFLKIRTGTFLPQEYDGLNLTWFEHDDDPSKEITLDAIRTMCSI